MAHPSSPAHDQATLDFYAREAAVYVPSGKGQSSRWLGGFMQELPAGARVLELGCGGGRDAAVMIAHGFDVVPTDGSPEMAAEAETLLNRTVRVMRFDELSERDAYDAVWANASLLHVPRDALSDVLGRVLRALKPGGICFASYKTGDTAGRDSLGRYFNYPGRDTLTAIYRRSGPWEVLSLMEDISSGYEGGQVPWIAMTVRRPPA